MTLILSCNILQVGVEYIPAPTASTTTPIEPDGLFSHSTTTPSTTTDVKLVPRDVYFYSYRDSLPHCGMPEFIRAAYTTTHTPHTTQTAKNNRSAYPVDSPTDSERVAAPSLRAGQGRQTPRKVCYEEDDRVVCTVVYLLCPCAQRLYGLSLPGLYCNVEEPSAALANGDCISILAESNGYSI